MSAYSDLKVPQLRKLCRSRNIRECIGSHYVRKDEIIRLLKDYDLQIKTVGTIKPTKNIVGAGKNSIRPIKINTIGTIKPTKIDIGQTNQIKPILPNTQIIKSVNKTNLLSPEYKCLLKKSIITFTNELIGISTDTTGIFEDVIKKYKSNLEKAAQQCNITYKQAVNILLQDADHQAFLYNMLMREFRLGDYYELTLKGIEEGYPNIIVITKNYLNTSKEIHGVMKEASKYGYIGIVNLMLKR